MSKASYPTGVENHGGSLRIWFLYQGQRVRENLGVPDTAKNRKVAGELRASVCFAIKMGSFNYAAQFPASSNLKRFGLDKKDISVGDLAEKWLDLKKMEISANAHHRYCSVFKNLVPLIGARRMISSVTKEELLFIRKDLLTGQTAPKKSILNGSKGRTVPTVNYYMATIAGLFRFAADNGYMAINPFSSITPLKKSKAEPDPLSREEFSRLIDACTHQQTKNLWSLAVYTGVRHGELVSLAWEDIDLKAGTMTIRRNHTKLGEFTLPKTDAGTDRVIHLIQPAIEVLKSQAELTRLGKQYHTEVKLREFGRSVIHTCTFVFNPQVVRRNEAAGHHYSVSSLGAMWESPIKRAGIRYRKAYQSRHTYACWSLSAGANPAFIASQMGHSSAQMVFSVYGKWMPENSGEQVALLNQKLTDYAPYVPHRLTS
ncbi:site-specific integrase [Pantoea sp. Bo_2]|uniref:Site-specific integrase n=1 Tax=Candidatus Pantoea gossypiicola TaxID=2608008 RepID=A0AB34CFN4_9GAMM|nr:MULTISPECIES: site-specific integrase [Pantoea]KAA5929165.1 site-specific integrase [Pantoea sp. VH_4]KAA5942291.1 site-specific integrase [Pantoea sp. VH_3]KAA5950131.1 site-specific integrase [Pantoea sp. VH_25]KAA5979941.1 site-specific integrase [Pantoea sp. M_3]KAA5980133.1 site-specific integrase [Pantoea sp. M_4]